MAWHKPSASKSATITTSPEYKELAAGLNTLRGRVKDLETENKQLQTQLRNVSESDLLQLLFVSKPQKVIRDDLYFSIPITRKEALIINSPQFLRLDRIKQLAFIHLIWPGARHTRFQHSLGVYHLARQALFNLLRSGDEIMPSITVADANTFVAAALLHDVGHYPYSHAVEELGTPIMRHEQVGARMITQSPLSDILENEWRVSPQRVADLVARSRQDLRGVDQLFHALLSGILDIDKLDYLVRDAHHCNVPYGHVDVSRLLESLTVYKTNGGEYTLAITDKGIGPLHSLIDSKRQMFANVYWHHGNRIATAMFLRAVQDAVFPYPDPRGGPRTVPLIAPADLIGQDDHSVFQLIRSKVPIESASRDLVDRLDTSVPVGETYGRRLYKRAIVVTYGEKDLFDTLQNVCFDPRRRREVELQLCETVGRLLGRSFKGHELLLDIPQPEGYEVTIRVHYADPPIGCKEYMDWDEATGMQSDDLERYQRYARKVTLMALDEELAKQVQVDPCRRSVMRVFQDLKPPLKWS